METALAETTAALLDGIPEANLDTTSIFDTLSQLFEQLVNIPYILDRIFEEIPIFSLYIATGFLILFTLFAIKMWKG